MLRVQQLVVEPITAKLKHSATIQELEASLESLKKEYESVCAENIAIKAMHLYADETCELRDFNKRYALRNGCVSQVLARHFSLNNQFFLVDAGSNQGVKKDMVALYCNSIVGRVVQVYPWYCKVSLITDADCKVAAMCLSKASMDKLVGKTTNKFTNVKSVSGIHEGINDVICTTMRYVSHLESVCVGDTVLSSGEGLIFPKGFALGKIIFAEKGDLFYEITIKPSLDFQTLGYCTLIAKEDIE